MKAVCEALNILALFSARLRGNPEAFSSCCLRTNSKWAGRGAPEKVDTILATILAPTMAGLTKTNLANIVFSAVLGTDGTIRRPALYPTELQARSRDRCVSV
jgi:hypothetical protein